MRWIARRLRAESGSKPTVTRLTNYLQQRVALRLTIDAMVTDLLELHRENADWNTVITSFNLKHGGRVKSRVASAVSATSKRRKVSGDGATPAASNSASRRSSARKGGKRGRSRSADELEDDLDDQDGLMWVRERARASLCVCV